MIWWKLVIVIVAANDLSVAAQDRWYWYQQAKSQLMKNLRDDRNYNVVKNLILFIGDGMGITTVTTARILGGQKKGKQGEENDLAFDKFQHVALAKTYNTDSQIGDSGACATALLCGVKGRFETVGLDDGGRYNNCQSSFQSRIPSLADWAQADGKSTGIVTTTRVTHATPAAMYSHSASRYWESDDKIPEDERQLCKDIARQLVENDPGRNINVILGGGRGHFLPRGTKAVHDLGRREDGRNLIDAWKEEKKARNVKYQYVGNKREFDSVDPNKVDYLLGLFNHGHMAYETDRDSGPDGEPSIAEMTKKAIQILQKNNKGFFLVVEGGRIDHSHHFNNAHRALVDTLALEQAVSEALQSTRTSEDTLIVVTSDHSHVFAFGGYAKRGNPILGLDTRLSDVDNMPYTTLLYTNGPGYNHTFKTGRRNLTGVNTEDKDYIQQSAVPRRWDTHGGEDVPVYAHGPMSHLFRGVVEQTYIPHAMAYAACIGPQRGDCESRRYAHLKRQVIECPSPHIDSDSAAPRTLFTLTSLFFSIINSPSTQVKHFCNSMNCMSCCLTRVFKYSFRHHNEHSESERFSFSIIVRQRLKFRYGGVKRSGTLKKNMYGCYYGEAR